MSVKEIGKLRRNLLIALVGALTLHSSVIAHQSKRNQKSPTQEMGETIKIDSSLVEVPVSVTDAAGRPVRNLTAGDFMLEENGRLQQIASPGSTTSSNLRGKRPCGSCKRRSNRGTRSPYSRSASDPD